MTVLAMLAAAGAAVGLWAGARRHGSTVARGYRWLAGAAVFWLAGLIMGMSAGPAGSSTAPGLADVAPLLALAATGVGVTVLASPEASLQDRPAARDTDSAGGGRGPILPGLADGYVTAVALLVIGWVVAFGPEFHRSGERPAAFLLDLLHPLADLAVLGALLPLLTVAWRRVLLPYLSLLATTGADSLGVGARVSGGHQGVLAQLAMIAALILLGASPWITTMGTRLSLVPWRWDAEEVAAGPPAAGGGEAAGDTRVTSAGASALIAAAVAGVAALVVVAGGLASAPASGMALVIAGGAAVLVIALRVLMLVRESDTAVRMWRRSSSALRDLADRTSDMVLLCDLDGTISYADPGSAGFSYPLSELADRHLAEFVHPEDITTVRAAVRQALGLPVGLHGPAGPPDAAGADPASPEAADSAAWMSAAELADADLDAAVPREGASGRFACRFRAIDGTWRHIESAVLLYRVPGEPPRVLLAARDASDEVALRQQVTHLTFHDGLTGLPNRAYVEERARGALANAGGAGSPIGAASADGTGGIRGGDEAGGGNIRAGVIFLDLDGFTAVNDSVGHGAGDLVLAQAARRLRAAVPANDTVARWGGDEFAVLVTGAGSAAEVTDLAERLAEAIAAEPFRVADREIALTASVGVAAAEDQAPGVVLRNADVALARAKDGGGSRVEVYAAHMHADMVRRVELAADLKRAIDRDELTLQYQPVVELATSRVVSAEALVQWRRGDEEVASRDLLAAAEDSGLTVALGDWAVRAACAQGARWRERQWDVGISVNLSQRQLSTPRLPDQLAAVLAECGRPPSALTIEVNERVLVEDAGLIAGRLAELRDLGVRLAIDDFGTGYASLAYLRELPVDIIKIAPSFVAGLGHDPTLTLLTRTVVQVGRELGMQVVAKGIEQPRQLTALKEMGCEYGQGFLVARPASAAGVEVLIRASSPSGGAASAPPRARVSKAGAA